MTKQKKTIRPEDDDRARMEASRAPLMEHLIELRRRLVYSIIGFVIAFVFGFHFAPQIYNFLVQPLADVLPGEDRRMIFTALTEAFFTYIKVGMFAAAAVSFPWVAVQIWIFVAPGLYRNERQAFAPFLIATPILFTLGAAMAYYWVFPTAWSFLLSFEAGDLAGGSLPIQLEAKVSEYLSLSMQLIFAFGVCFEMPVILTLLTRVGVINTQWLREKRRFAIVINFIIAAIFTPPDPVSMLILAVPMVLLYEISIWACWLIDRRKNSQKNSENPGDEPVTETKLAAESPHPDL